METLRDIAPYVALGAAALSLVLLILVIVLLARVGKLRRAQTVVLGHHEQRDIVAHTEDLDTQVRNLREAVEILTDQLDDQKRHLDRALTNRAIIRYDAFRDAGGEQSASFAPARPVPFRRRLQRHRRAGLRAHLRQARHRRRRRPRPLAGGSPGDGGGCAAAAQGGEESPKARRAPLPESPPRPACRRPGTRPAAETAPTLAAGGERRAFDALGEAVGPAPAQGDRPAGGGGCPGRPRRLHVGTAAGTAARRRRLPPLRRRRLPGGVLHPTHASPPPAAPRPARVL